MRTICKHFLFVFSREIREILRNRRSLFFAFFLPLFLYPVLVVFFSSIEKRQAQVIEKEPLRIVLCAEDPCDSIVQVTGCWLNNDTLLSIIRLEDSIISPEYNSQVPILASDSCSYNLEPDGIRRLILNEKLDAFVLMTLDKVDSLPLITVYFSGDKETEFAKIQRLTNSLDSLRLSIFDSRAVSAGILNPLKEIKLEIHDSSMATARSGKFLGSILPLLILFLALTGGSFVALDTVAGERERNTLECLLAQPVERIVIISGKAGAVLLAAVSATVFSGIGLILGNIVMPMNMVATADLAFPDISGIICSFAIILPLTFEITGLLMVITCISRSFKEAQNYLFPVTLLLLIPAGIATSGKIELSVITALIPVFGQSVAFKELLAGNASFFPVFTAVVTGFLYGFAGLFWSSKLISGEGILLVRSRGTRNRMISPARRAFLLGILILLGLYYLSGLISGMSVVSGILVSEWGFVLGITLVFIFLFSVKPVELGFRKSEIRGFLLAVFTTIPLVFTVIWIFRIQSVFFPVPEYLVEIMKPLSNLNIPVSVLVLAFTPAICEELLFRGVILRQLMLEVSKTRAVIISAILFGVFHLSFYRFLPTFAVGLVLGMISVVTGSIFPSILLHFSYNAATLFLIDETTGLPVQGFNEAVTISSVLLILILFSRMLKKMDRNQL